MTISGSGIAGGARPSYYDRAPSGAYISFETALVGPHSVVTRGSYTVPTARSAYLEWFDIAVVRGTAASTPGKLGIMLGIVDTDAGFKIVSNSILSVSQNSINSNRYTHGGLTMLLRAGDELRYETLDYSTGGTVYYQATAKLLEFTA